MMEKTLFIHLYTAFNFNIKSGDDKCVTVKNESSSGFLEATVLSEF